MVKNPFESIVNRIREKREREDPRRFLKRLQKRYEDTEWNDKVDAVLRSDSIPSIDKFTMLLKIKNLRLEHLAPFILNDPAYKHDFRESTKGDLLFRLKDIEWSPLVGKILFSKDVSRGEKLRLFLNIKTPIAFQKIKDEFQRPYDDESYMFSLAEKTFGASWKDCQKIPSKVLRNMLYFNTSAHDLKPHRFLHDLTKEAGKAEHEGKDYAEMLELYTRAVFDDVTQMREKRGELTRHPPENIAENGKRLMSIAGDLLSLEEKASLEKLGIDISKNVLQLYLRYTNIINYGPVADALQLCTAWFFENRYSKFFNGSRIIPSRNQVLPPVPLMPKIRGTEVANVSGPDFMALIKFPTVYFTHSTFHGKTPAVTSAATQGNEHCVASKIELEEEYRGSEFAKNATMEEIVREYVQNLIELDAKLEEFLAKKLTEK